MYSSGPQPAPTRANLKAWWNSFTSAPRGKKEVGAQGEAEEVHPVFGKPLRESLKYASVHISTANANGDLYVWGYIPVVVAKCGLYLKEHGTEVEGTFRVNGSNKRMRELQAIFETPPLYGKALDWKKENYTTHDVASVFRRYLTQMPEPVIPHELYHEFRQPLAKKQYSHEDVIPIYKRLLARMPRANQYLLLYVLDLLSVFARRSDKNLMTAGNLAVIFRPGIISHPDHEMSPQQHQLSQEVLEFLIAHQDWFMLDIPPPPESDPSLPSPTPILAAEDISVVPSSDEETSQASGSWKLVGKDDRKAVRRRTFDQEITNGNSLKVSEASELSPVAEVPPTSPLGVVRSRTLPTSRDQDTAPARVRVLQKKKRKSSSQPPLSIPTKSPTTG